MERLVVIDRVATIFGLSDYEKNILSQKLTVVPRLTSEYSKPVTIQAFELDGDGFAVPRMYFLKNATRDYTIKYKTSNGDVRKFNSKIDLWPEQVPLVEKIMAAFSNKPVAGGILVAGTGSGKTVVALEIARLLGVTTSIIVYKQDMITHWVRHIHDLLPGSRVGIVQQDNCQYGDGVDFNIMMIESLVAREYPKVMYNWCGFVIFDECDKGAAPVWNKVLRRFPARYFLGLTATAERTDKTERLFFWHIGDVLTYYRDTPLIPVVKRIFTPFRLVKTKQYDPNKLPKATLIRALIYSKARNRVIVENMIEAVKADRKVLVISERIKHLDILARMFKERIGKLELNKTFDYYIGGRSPTELTIAARADIVLATYKMAERTVNIPWLDTIMLATPIYHVEQAAGRVLRIYEGKKQPIVVDFVDLGVGRLRGYYKGRLKFYKKKGWMQ